MNENKKPIKGIAKWGVLITIASAIFFIIFISSSWQQITNDEIALAFLIMQIPVIISSLIFAFLNNSFWKWTSGMLGMIFSGIIGGTMILFAKTENWREELKIITPATRSENMENSNEQK